jgi:hypothetical protein
MHLEMKFHAHKKFMVYYKKEVTYQNLTGKGNNTVEIHKNGIILEMLFQADRSFSLMNSLYYAPISLGLTFLNLFLLDVLPSIASS